MTEFSFDISHRDGAARRGVITTGRGNIQTPAFMPVGTQGTVKALYMDQVRETGADIILGNTYHLMLRPGAERVARLGGLHDFIKWDGPILTDSGGFQVMSLASLRKLNENGVTFQSHIDGSRHELTPERSMEIQHLLGSTIQMQLDECVAYPHETSEAERAMELSLRWAERSRKAFRKQAGNASFGIVQGGIDASLRVKSARELAAMDFEGYAIGGLAVGEGQELMLSTIDVTVPHMPTQKPRYLMGVGTPHDLLESIKRGVDMFDCVMPTRSGRHGQAFTRHGKFNLKNARFAEDLRPLDETARHPALTTHSRAYIHHLVRANEMLGMMLLSWANIAYYQELMADARTAIEQGRYDDFVAEAIEGWEKGEQVP